MSSSFRRFISVALLLTPLVTPLAGNAVFAQAASDVMPVPDPAAGAVASVLPLPAGWHGHAYMDRTTDALSNGIATAVFDVSSGDNQIHLQSLPWQFHTYSPAQKRVAAGLPGDPAHARNAAYMPFTSAGDLLQNQILPLLRLDGRSATITRATQEQRMAAAQHMPEPGPIFDGATAVLSSGGHDTVVIIVSSGGGAGTSQEVTATAITVLTAPTGQGLKVWQELQKTMLNHPPTPQWRQANSQYLERWRQQRIAESNAIVARNQQVGQMVIQRARRTQQAIDDSAAYSAAVVGDKNLALKWCGPSGSSQITINQITPPAPGYQRCN